WSSDSPRRTQTGPRRTRPTHFRPRLEGLEERVVPYVMGLSSAASGQTPKVIGIGTSTVTINVDFTSDSDGYTIGTQSGDNNLASLLQNSATQTVVIKVNNNTHGVDPHIDLTWQSDGILDIANLSGPRTLEIDNPTGAINMTGSVVDTKSPAGPELLNVVF